jgi:hypothetical protein
VLNNLKIKSSRILRSRLALSAVVTTLIILVISVLLAGVVSYFAINVTSTRVQEESLLITKPHIWCPQDSTDNPQAAFSIVNTGGRDVVITKVTVRGQEAVTSNVYYGTTEDPITEKIAYTTLSGDISVDIGDGNSVALKASTGALTLNTGKTLIIYIDNPDSISVNDVGLTVGITVFTSQAMYYKESNVQTPVIIDDEEAQPESTPIPEEAFISNEHTWYNEAESTSQAAFLVTNGLSEAVTITSVDLAGDPIAEASLFIYKDTFSLDDDLTWITDVGVDSATVLGGAATLSAVDDFPITLEAGQSMIVYIRSPANIVVANIGHASMAIGVTLQSEDHCWGFADVLAP